MLSAHNRSSVGIVATDQHKEIHRPFLSGCPAASNDGEDEEEDADDNKGDCGLGEEGGAVESIVHKMIIRREKTNYVHYRVLGIFNEDADGQQQHTTDL